jgi:GYF domain 2
MSDAWYFHDGKKKFGPFALHELIAKLATYPNPLGIFTWRAGFEGWRSSGDVPELANLLSAPPPPCLPTLRADPESRIGLSEAKGTASHNNFIAKNWRGEYPLWLTYWIFGFLGNIILLGIANVAIEVLFANAAYEPHSAFVAVSFIWLWRLAVSIWLLVAIWRSASRSIQERKRIGKGGPWAELAMGGTILGVFHLIAAFATGGLPQLAELSRMAFADDPSTPAYSIRVMRDGTEAEITGGFKYGLTDDFLKILRASSRINVVHLNSLGGRIGEAESLNKIIRDRGLITYTSYRCLSACTVAFAGGRERWVDSRAKLGFHGPGFPGMSDADMADSVKAQEEIFRKAGFEARFIKRALATPNKDMWIPSLDELRDANVITNISNGGDFAASGLGAEVTRESMAADLTKALPLLQALKERFPTKYDTVMDAYYESYVTGRTQNEMIIAARSTLLPIIRSYADDAVLVELAKLYADQYAAIGQINHSSCYQYASGLAAPSDLPDSLIQRELDVNARIILTAATRPTANEQVTGPIWEKVSKQLSAKGVGRERVKLLQSTSVYPSQYAEYCNATVAFLREIANLKPAEAAALLREMWSTD